MKNREEYKKDIHHIHDKSYKDLYSKKEVAIDLFKSFFNEKKYGMYLLNLEK